MIFPAGSPQPVSLKPHRFRPGAAPMRTLAYQGLEASALERQDRFPGRRRESGTARPILEEVCWS